MGWIIINIKSKKRAVHLDGSMSKHHEHLADATSELVIGFGASPYLKIIKV